MEASAMGKATEDRMMERAYRLAHSGRYSDWKAIEQELQSEGFLRAADLLNDGRVREELNHICAEATMGTYRDA
jgi:hypothetical protein